MKTFDTLPADTAFDSFTSIDARPETPAFLSAVRQAVAHAARMVTGTPPETARNRFLAEATDAVDLERRMAAWERAREIQRGLPTAL